VNPQNHGYYHVKNLPCQLNPSKFYSVLRLIVNSSVWMVRHHHQKQQGNLAKPRRPPNEEKQGNKFNDLWGKMAED